MNSAATDEATSATLILMKTSGCQQESGRDKLAAECVSVAVEWPHCHVFRGADRHPAKYDDLTILKFVAGYMKKNSVVLANIADTKNDTLMLKYLSATLINRHGFSFTKVQLSLYFV